MKVILTVMLVLATMMSGCFNSSNTKDTTSKSGITTQQEAAHTVAMVRSMRLDALAQGVSSSVGANQAMQATDVSYPINYSIHRDCNVSGTADTDGQKISDTEYNATNTFNSCSQIPGISVDGTNHVYAQLNGNDLYAELTQNDIDVDMGSLYMRFAYDAPMKFYSDKNFSFATIILDGGVALSENPSEGEFGPTIAEDGGEDGYHGDFHDFNVTMTTDGGGVPTLELNGTLDIFACGKESFNIQTVTPLTIAVNGTFSAGTLNINGALFEYSDDKTVKVTLADGTEYSLPQGLDPMCTLDSGSTLIGSTRDAMSHNFLEDVNVSARLPLDTLAGEYAVESDTNGNFKLKDLLDGVYQLSFEKAGYITANAYFLVNENTEENFGLIDLIPNTQADQNITFSGVVKNAQTGATIDGATITLHSGYHSPRRGEVVSTFTSDTNGNFSAEIPTGYYSVVVYKDGFILSDNISVSCAEDTYKDLTLTPTVTASTAVITLTWGADPRDLDSHLIKKDVYEVYYGNENYQSADTNETASLDVDDTNGYGPETITLDNLDSASHYKYYVYHYGGSETIATSDAVVTVNFGSETYTFRPPNQSGRTWTVFTIENGHLIPCTGTCIQ